MIKKYPNLLKPILKIPTSMAKKLSYKRPTNHTTNQSEDPASRFLLGVLSSFILDCPSISDIAHKKRRPDRNIEDIYNPYHPLKGLVFSFPESIVIFWEWNGSLTIVIFPDPLRFPTSLAKNVVLFLCFHFPYSLLK